MGQFSKPSVQRVAEQCMATPSCVASFNPTFYSGEILPWEKGIDWLLCSLEGDSNTEGLFSQQHLQ